MMHFLKLALAGIVRKNSGRHPFACNDELLLTISQDVRPFGAAHHSHVRYVGVLCFCHVNKMPLAIIYKNEAFGSYAIQFRKTA